MLRSIILAAALLATFSWSPGVGATDLDEFERLAEEGHVLYDRGEYAEAEDRFRKAAPLAPCPTAALWLGKSLEKQGLLGEALDAFTMAAEAKVEPDATRPCINATTEAQAASEDLREKVGYVALRIKGASVEDVSLFVNGRARRFVTRRPETWPEIPTGESRLGYWPIPAEPGTTTVEARVGDAIERESVAVERNTTTRLVLDFTPPGSHRAENAETGAGASGERGEPASHPESRRSLKPWGFGALGLGGAGLAVASITGLVVMDKTSAVRDECYEATGTCSAEGIAARDDGMALATVSTVSFGVGIAAVAAGVVLLIVEPRQTRHGSAPLPDTARRLRPVVRGGRSHGFLGVESAW